VDLVRLHRLVAAGVLLAGMPAAAVLPPLGGVVVSLAALIAVEGTRYAPVRRSFRGD
jgi:hypothetical protein